METLAFVLVMIGMAAVLGGQTALLLATYQWALPRIERWLWRRLGGQGEPPSR